MMQYFTKPFHAVRKSAMCIHICAALKYIYNLKKCDFHSVILHSPPAPFSLTIFVEYFS